MRGGTSLGEIYTYSLSLSRLNSLDRVVPWLARWLEAWAWLCKKRETPLSIVTTEFPRSSCVPSSKTGHSRIPLSRYKVGNNTTRSWIGLINWIINILQIVKRMQIEYRGSEVLEATVKLISKGSSKLDLPLRCICSKISPDAKYQYCALELDAA